MALAKKDVAQTTTASLTCHERRVFAAGLTAACICSPDLHADLCSAPSLLQEQISSTFAQTR